MNTIEVKVPDIGDFKDVPVIEVFVKPGDAVKAEDSLVTLESDKATMDVPAPAPPPQPASAGEPGEGPAPSQPAGGKPSDVAQDRRLESRTSAPASGGG